MQIRFVAATLVALFAAAASAAADKTEGRPAPATLPAPAEGQGQVLFWRSGTVVGGGMGCGVNIGKERISALGAGHYFILPLPPGAHQFNAKSEAKDVLNVEVKPGETSYVKCTIKMGIMVGRPNLSPSTAEEYEKKRGDLKYVDSDDIGAKVMPDPSPAVAATP
ncbi:DUF2846 domain-containing protein [Sandarakinorhabdus sp.]|uniref:DUF2846 domain-containing protein n=1 Tax=Sandarakinorhabdus sp. TaxID=1916663 RepID=UPI00286DC694|nr:DUF2846 domain-containing protein [Sandarakinorhabdus sp.]